jgi:hypothetical protein
LVAIVHQMNAPSGLSMRLFPRHCTWFDSVHHLEQGKAERVNFYNPEV